MFGISIRRSLKKPRARRAFNLSMGAILFVLALLFLR
jgi:threonine/homoserine/homoserine lactone efflux protein